MLGYIGLIHVITGSIEWVAAWISSSTARAIQRGFDIASAGSSVFDLGLGAASLVKLTRVGDELSSVAAGSQAERLDVVTNKTTVLNWKAWKEPKANPDAVPDMSVLSSGRQESGQNADTLLFTPTRESVRRDLNNLPDGQGENHTVRQLSNGQFTTVRKDIHLSHPIKVTDEGQLYTPLKQAAKGSQSVGSTAKVDENSIDEELAKELGTGGFGNGVTNKISSQLAQNKAAGDVFEQQVMDQLKRKQNSVVQQVTVRTKSGIRTRIDLMSRDVSGNIVCTECKSSVTAPLTKNQKAAFPEIQQSGGIVVGQGKPGYPKGTQIPPGTVVNIVRPSQKE